uniref:Uncharacterized protein n=1 Tax=Anguilla anguilla TaxID=7936 RepID=A0A0E9V049_ANGAN
MCFGSSEASAFHTDHPQRLLMTPFTESTFEPAGDSRELSYLYAFKMIRVFPP